MSTFYCIAHDRIEDSDFVGYYITNSGEEMCEASADEMFADPYTSVEVPAESDSIGDRWSHDDMLELNS